MRRKAHVHFLIQDGAPVFHSSWRPRRVASNLFILFKLQCQHGAPEPTPYLLAIAFAHGDHFAGVLDYPLLACLGILVLTSEATRGTRRRCVRRRASRRCRCRSNCGSEAVPRPPAASDAAAENDDMQRIDIQPGKGDTTRQGKNCQDHWNDTSWYHGCHPHTLNHAAHSHAIQGATVVTQPRKMRFCVSQHRLILLMMMRSYLPWCADTHHGDFADRLQNGDEDGDDSCFLKLSK